MDNVDPETVAVGAGILAAVVAGIWKSATLKGETQREWASRAELVAAGLDTKATQALVRLHAGIERTFTPSHFDPGEISEDPDTFRVPVDEYSRALKLRSRVFRDVSRIKRIGPVLAVSLAVLGVGVTLLTLELSGALDSVRLRIAGFALAGGGLFPGAGCLVGYVVLNNRLANAEAYSTEGLDA